MGDMKDVKRDERGYFLPGHKGGPGNPTVSMATALKLAWQSATTPDRMVTANNEIWAMCLDKSLPAKDRLKALMYYADRHIGKPTENVEITTEVRQVLTRLSPQKMAEVEAFLAKLGDDPVIDVDVVPIERQPASD